MCKKIVSLFMIEDVDEIIFLGGLNILNVYRFFLVWYVRINEKKRCINDCIYDVICLIF